MRIALFSTVSLLALAVVTPAHAGFQFVPAPAATASASANTAAPGADKAVPSISNPEVASENLPAGNISATTAPMNVPAMASSPVPAMTDTSAPMQLGAKAIPLTPVVKNSDALMLDDAAPAMLPEATIAMPAPKKENSDVLWDSGIRSPMKPVEEPKPVIMSSTAKPSITQSDLNDGPAIQGFGRKVPLALALQQIVPPNYRYSFDYGVDAGQRVSWTGGKPWKAVVTDLAQSNGMNVDIVNNVIAFHHRSPMEVVSAQSSVDMSKDTVQGMTLKPISNSSVATDMTVLPPLDSSDLAPVTGDNAPMSILPMASADKTLPERQPLGAIGNEGMSDLPPPVITEKTTIIQPPAAKSPDNTGATKVADNKSQSAGNNAFDPLMDDKMADKPSNKKVANKTIDIADESAMSAPMPVSAPVASAAPVITASSPSVAAISAPAPVTGGKHDNLIFDNPPATASSDTPDRLMKKLDEAKKADAVSAPISSETLTAPMPTMTPLPPTMSVSADNLSNTAPAMGADLSSSQEWAGEKDATLRSVLTEWSLRSGVSLVWSSEYDYPLQTAVRIEGDYPDAVRTLLAGFAKAEPRPLGRLFKNKSIGGQPVLVIETQRLTNK